MKSLLIVLLSITWYLLGIIPVYSQNIYGHLDGRLYDAKNNPVQGATIVATGSNLQGSKATISDINGYFKLTALPVGEYNLKIDHISFHDVLIESVSIDLGKTTNLENQTLQIRDIVLEEVTYKWTEPIINTSSYSVEGNLKPEFFETLPTGRDYLSVITLLPRVNESFLGDEPNISGASGSDNIYFIDGMNVTDPYAAASGTKLPFNFVKEIEVKQNGFEAEYGKALGGIVNVITYSGTNEFEADAFGFYTDDILMEEPKLATYLYQTISNRRKYDVGASVKGPFIKNKLWYNIAYNYIFDTKDIEIEGFDPLQNEKREHIIAAKINWLAPGNTQIDLSIIADPTQHINGGETWWPISGKILLNTDPAISISKRGGINMILNARNQINEKLFLEGSAFYSFWNENREGYTDMGKSDPLYIDYITDAVSGGYGNALDYSGYRTGVRIKGTYFLPKHEIKVGIEFEKNEMDYFEAITNPGLLERQDDEFWSATTLDANAVPRSYIPGFFVQDAWKISKKVQLNYGFRWEGQYLRGTLDTVNISLNDQLQPRIGIIYLLGNSGKNKIFGSYGRYYAQYPLYPVWDKLCPYDQFILFYNSDPRSPDAVPFDTMKVISKDKPFIFGGEKLKGEFADEIIIGYDQEVWKSFLISLKGIYRETKNNISNSFDMEGSEGLIVIKVGNPGYGILDYLPAARHSYKAIEFSFGKLRGKNFTFNASYVFSKCEGNYTGLYDQDFLFAMPGNNVGYQLRDQIHNSDGLLPNDHMHNVKVTTSYNFNFGLSTGAYFNYISGAPLNDYGQSEIGFERHVYLQPRGRAGRLPSLWDLNFRFLYDFKINKLYNSVYLDIFHVGSPQQRTQQDQVHYDGYLTDSEGNVQRNEFGQPIPDPDSENENYGNATSYQPPMMIRVGYELKFK